MKIFKAESFEEMVQRIENRDVEVAIEIHKNILRGVKRKRCKSISVFDIQLSDGTVIGFSIDKVDWPKALNTCIEVLAENDMFEECIEAKKVLDDIK